jgi:sugar phosphate isomerase/epimerase
VKLCLLTYNMARHWDLAKIIAVANACGCAGLEFRTEAGHEHGVELERTAAERRQIRDQVEDAYLETSCIGTGSRFDSPDPAQRSAVVERTKRYIELAAGVGCRRIRVFGNDVPAGVSRSDCCAYVGDCLRELGEFADPYGVDVLLEMHGQFNYWGFARAAVEKAGHPRVAIVYNCDQRDVIAGSVAATYGSVRDQIRHVHMHDFTVGYPYPELFALLKADHYAGYLSTELGTEHPTPEQFLALYATLFRAWAGQPLS